MSTATRNLLHLWLPRKPDGFQLKINFNGAIVGFTLPDTDAERAGVCVGQQIVSVAVRRALCLGLQMHSRPDSCMTPPRAVTCRESQFRTGTKLWLHSAARPLRARAPCCLVFRLRRRRCASRPSLHTHLGVSHRGRHGMHVAHMRRNGWMRTSDN